MMKRAARVLTGLLCLCLIMNPFAALSEEATTEPSAAAESSAAAEPSVTPSADEVMEDPEALAGKADETQAEDEDAVHFTAVATVGLKVRMSADEDARGIDSIDKGDIVYIIEPGDDWSRVSAQRNIGYVLTKYLSNIREYTASGGTVGAEVTLEPTATPDADTAGDTPDAFEEKFVAYTYKPVIVRKGMSDDSGSSFSIAQYKEVTVGAVHGAWSYIRYKNSYGYVLTSKLFRWDRIDPYAGDIPGCIKHIGLAFVNHTTDIRDYTDKKGEVLKTVNPGSALAVDALDDQGRYSLAYWRTTGYVEESDVGYLMEVVPWEDAESGDMISCMSTYYAVGVHTLQYQGRNWNIYLGSTFISGTVVQPGETMNTHDMMGPYRRSTGYHRAPVMAQHTLSGYGGGCCQVNTTLYNVLIQVPIYINWRKVHAEVGIYYCPVGFDAAVGGGDTTMIFTNTLPYAIRINYFMSDGCLTVALFRV